MSLGEYHPQFWRETFSPNIIKTRIIPVPKTFIQYIQADGLVLPQRAIVHTLGRDELPLDETMREVEAEGPPAPAFLDLNDAIETAIRDLGGKVFVKLNGKAPVDAAWINGGSMACITAGEVYLLLKASTRVAQHVDMSGQDDSDAIVIKKWANLYPSMEFRCFVRNKVLLGTLACI